MKHLILTFVALCLLLVSLSGFAAPPRNMAARHAFRKATGYPHGRPGFVVDHKLPLCAGGADAVANMQWQAVAAAKVKDIEEKQLCAAIRAFEQQWAR